MTIELRKKNFRRFFLALLLAISASSCSGWRLRGADTNVQLVNNSIHLSGQASDTYSLIEQQLNRKNSLTDFSSASYRLIVNQEQWQRRRASVTSSISTAEYELTLRVGYKILNGNNQVIRPDTLARVTRSYTFDENDVAGKDKEEDIIRGDMRGAVARQILFQLQLLNR